MPTRTTLTALILIAGAACGDAGDGADDVAAGGPDAREDVRPEARTDTLMLEGMPEPIELRLFRAPEEFPLRFGAYVPRDMAVEVEPAEDDEGSSIRFIARFGGVRNPDAFIHLYVHPAGTDPQEALGVVRAYEVAQGVPVSGGIEPLPEPEPADRMPWADASYVFRSQAADGGWIVGSIGLGSHAGRLFHIVQRYPAEYGDGFGPRADLILETWRWADGSDLRYPGSSRTPRSPR